MLGVFQRWARQSLGSQRIFFGHRWFKYGTPGGSQGGPANRGPAKVQHTGGEEDKDPGVDDGVNGDEAEGNQVQTVRLCAIPYGVDVHPDLRDG